MAGNNKLFFLTLFTGLFLLLGWISTPLMDVAYGQWVYPSVRLILNTLSWLLPIPLFKLVFGGVFLFVGLGIIKHLRDKSFGLRVRFWRVLGFVSRTALFIACSFYWLWGFNYFVSSPVEKLSLSTDPVPSERVFELLEEFTMEVNSLRGDLFDAGYIESEDFFKTEIDYQILTQQLNDFLKYHNFVQYSTFPVRHWRPKGILLRNSTAGMYFPFTGEATVDPGLHPLQIPFTVSHEMGHSAGFTDEGFCNLVAYLVTTNSDDILVRYSGYLAIWRYIARAARSLNREEYGRFIENNLSELVVADLESIYENRAKYPDLFPGLQRRVYDSYLRAHGISEGVESYSQMLILADSYDRLYR